MSRRTLRCECRSGSSRTCYSERRSWSRGVWLDPSSPLSTPADRSIAHGSRTTDAHVPPAPGQAGPSARLPPRPASHTREDSPDARRLEPGTSRGCRRRHCHARAFRVPIGHGERRQYPRSGQPFIFHHVHGLGDRRAPPPQQQRVGVTTERLGRRSLCDTTGGSW